jgi:hypothetical protein
VLMMHARLRKSILICMLTTAGFLLVMYVYLMAAVIVWGHPCGNNRLALTSNSKAFAFDFVAHPVVWWACSAGFIRKYIT